MFDLLSEERRSKMTPGLRKLTLTAHIVFSVGWLGAVVAYLALALTGFRSGDADVMRSVYGALELLGWFVIVPFSLTALASGLVQSLATDWGLFRYYWILTKFVLTVLGTIILLVHMQTVSRVAELAREMVLTGADSERLKLQLLLHAIGGLVVLLIATVLSVYKPWGKTAYGRYRDSQLIERRSIANGFSRRYLLVGVIVLAALLFGALHLLGGGMSTH